MKFRTGLVAVVLLGTSGAACAQDWFHNNNQGGSWGWRDNRDNFDKKNNSTEASETQKRACEPDVFRVCGRYIPDRDAITSCLHHNVNRLNPDCRAVIEGRLK